MFRHRFDANGDVIHSEVDGRNAVRLARLKKGYVMKILCISRREIARQSPKELELIAFGAEAMTRPHWSATARKDACRQAYGLPLRRQHGRCARSDVDALAPDSTHAWKVLRRDRRTRPPSFE